MSKELVISANRHETKVALIEDDQLVEVYFQRSNEYSLAGSIHKGRVTRVLPGMQSAFVDVGLERDTFLYVSDFLEEHDDFDKITGDERPVREDRDRDRDRAGIADRGRDTRRRPAEPAAESSLRGKPLREAAAAASSRSCRRRRPLQRAPHRPHLPRTEADRRPAGELVRSASAEAAGPAAAAVEADTVSRIRSTPVTARAPAAPAEAEPAESQTARARPPIRESRLRASRSDSPAWAAVPVAPIVLTRRIAGEVSPAAPPEHARASAASAESVAVSGEPTRKKTAEKTSSTNRSTIHRRTHCRTRRSTSALVEPELSGSARQSPASLMAEPQRKKPSAAEFLPETLGVGRSFRASRRRFRRPACGRAPARRRRRQRHPGDDSGRRRRHRDRAIRRRR